MPYPLQITREGVVQAAADLIAQHGVDALSLSAVAGVLGVKAPSLYRHFDAKTALVRAVNQHTVERLTAHLLAAVQPAAGTGERVRQMCRAYRRFALDHPRLYAAAYLHTHPEWAVGGEVAERLGSAMQAALGAVDLSMLRGRRWWGGMGFSLPTPYSASRAILSSERINLYFRYSLALL